MRSSTAASPVMLSIVRAPTEDLEVPPPLAAGWSRLAPAIRRHLSAFLGPACPPAHIVVAGTDAPASLRDDLVSGGSQLRAAFPHLVRRLASIDGETVRVTCEGAHDGSFFGFMLPTRRRVRFDEVHRLALDRNGVVEDGVTLDLRAIVRQLVSGVIA